MKRYPLKMSVGIVFFATMSCAKVGEKAQALANKVEQTAALEAAAEGEEAELAHVDHEKEEPKFHCEAETPPYLMVMKEGLMYCDDGKLKIFDWRQMRKERGKDHKGHHEAADDHGNHRAPEEHGDHPGHETHESHPETGPAVSPSQIKKSRGGNFRCRKHYGNFTCTRH